MNGLPIISGLETATEKIRGAVDQHPSPLYEEQGGSVKQDDLVLNRLGKKPVLRRRFGLISIFALNCLNLNTWGTAFQVIGLGLLNGGPAGSVYGWIFVWLGGSAVLCCLAELASMSPTSGGQYHWVSLLAPTSSQKFLSYVTGWLTVLGWLSGVAASTYISGTILQALIQLVNPSYAPQLWQGTLLVYGVLALCLFFTIVLGRALPLLETSLLVFYAFGYFAVLIPMVHLAPQQASAQTVFTMFINRGGWSSQGLSFFVGISGWAFATLGGDAAVHMSEEVHNAAVIVPRSMLISIAVNSTIGGSMLLAQLFCIPDPEGLLNLGLQYPFIQVFLNSTGSVVGSALMVAINIINQVGLNITNVATASRMLWSFSRDKGVPGWRHITRVTNHSRLPVTAILVTTVFAMLVVLISVGSSVAFNDVISLTVGSLFCSYLLVCSLLLWRRCTGSVVSPSSQATHDSFGANTPGAAGKLVWGPFHMRGYLGIFVNAVACAYMVVVLFFVVWPPATPTTAASMNYAIVMFSAVAMLATVYYLVWARKTYKGPVIETSRSEPVL